jgi:hypothetical protein
MRTFHLSSTLFIVVACLSCGKKSSKGESGGSGSGGGVDSSKIQLNLSGAVGLAKLGDAQPSGLLFDSENGLYADAAPVNPAQEKKKMVKFKFEIYSLAKSGVGELAFSGLDFSNNEFGVGFIKLDTLQAEMKDDLKVKVTDIVPID